MDKTNQQVIEKVVEAANKIIKQNNALTSTLKRHTDYLSVNEQNVREIYGMINDLKKDMKIMHVKVNRIEALLQELK